MKAEVMHFLKHKSLFGYQMMGEEEEGENDENGPKRSKTLTAPNVSLPSKTLQKNLKVVYMHSECNFQLNGTPMDYLRAKNQSVRFGPATGSLTLAIKNPLTKKKI